jgi:hypothetical protein
MRREGLMNIDRFLNYKMSATTGTPESSINLTDFVPVLCILMAGAVIAVLLLAAELCAKKVLSRNKAFKY